MTADALEQERALRRERERALVEMRLRAEAAEAQLASVRQTLSFGLGQALVEALTPKGLMRLPGRLLELRRAQAVKRSRVPGQSAEQRPAEAVRFVAEALARAERDGIAAAGQWIGSLTGAKGPRGRALAEAALARLGIEPEQALEAGIAAAALAPGEPRLAELAARAFTGGAIAGPARLAAAIDPRLRAGPFRNELAALDREAARAAEGWHLPEPAGAGQGTARAVVAARTLPYHRDRIALSAAAAAAAHRGIAVLVTPPGYPAGAGELAGEDAGESGAEASGEGATEHYRGAFGRAQAGAVHLVLDEVEDGFAAVAAARRLGLPVTLEVTRLPAGIAAEARDERTLLQSAGLAVIAAASARVVARSEAYGAAMRRLCPGLAIEVQAPSPAAPPLPLGEEESASLDEALEVARGVALIVCPVPLADDPGLFELVAALSAIGGGAATLLFTAGGPAAPALRREAARLGVAGEVVFLADLLPAEQEAWLIKADLLVFPRQGEGTIAADPSSASAVARATGRPCLHSPEEARWAGTDAGLSGFVQPAIIERAAALAHAMLGSRAPA